MALAAGLSIRIVNMSGWIMWVVTGIFENIGAVQEGMETISRAHEVVDAPDARPLKVPKGEIRYDGIRFHYGKEKGVIDRPLAHHPAGREGRARRPLGRGQVDARQSAACASTTWKAGAS